MKKNTQPKEEANYNNKGYGILSLIGMTIGIVIGSGIFVKNQEIVESTGSCLLSICTWLVGALIVFSIFIVFIEIISITEISGEQSTLTNWGNHLLGIRFGKVAGCFMTFMYLPIMVVTLFSFGSDEIVRMFEANSSTINSYFNKHAWIRIIIVILSACIFLAIIGAMNSYTVKPGKILQNVGAVIKIVPMIFIILLFGYLLIFNINEIDFSQNIPTFNEDYPNYGLSPFTLILLTIPAALFAFDGFLLAGPLSKEGKTEQTFRYSFIVSLIFLVVVYVLFSLAIIGLGDASSYVITEDGGILWNHGAYGTISNAIYAGIGNDAVSHIIAPIVSVIIISSIITCASGFIISGARMLTDMSASNLVKDAEGKYITRNRWGVSVAAGNSILIQCFVWLFILEFFNIILFSITGEYQVITSFSSELGAIGAFTVKMFIIGGAIVNRFTNKVKVRKYKFFLPVAVLSLILTSTIVIWFAFTTIAPYNYIMGQLGTETSINLYWSEYSIKLAAFVVIIAYTSFVVVFNHNKSKKLTNKEIHNKELQKVVYYS